MRTETKTIEIYKYEELNDKAKEKVRNEFMNCHYFDYLLVERIETLKKFASVFNLELDYSFGLTPYRGQYITFKGELNLKDFKDMDINELCGQYCDDDLIDEIVEMFKEENVETLNKVDLYYYIKYTHAEFEANLEDGNLQELCEINDYEFLKDGTIY